MSVHDEARDLCEICAMPQSTDERRCYCDCDHDTFVDGECLECGWECRHRDIEDFYCVACGEDCTEHVMARAEDWADAMEDR